MKLITGYLLDRATGLGVSGKTVAFTKLDGTPVATSDTYYLNKSSVTDANGRFFAQMELSPGPVNVSVTVSGSEIKARKWDEQAMLGTNFSSDLYLLARNNYGVINGFLNEMLLSTPSGHNIRVQTGAAFFNGNVFSIENNYYEVAGTANSNSSLNPRLDRVTLRQYNTGAAGQNAGRQLVVVTLGTAQNVVPTLPTGADFVDFPIGVVSTAYNAASKTVYRDDRDFNDDIGEHQHNLDFSQLNQDASITQNNEASITINCPAGERVVGGGFRWPESDIGRNDLRILWSYPNTNTSWRCGFRNDSGGTREATCYAVCLDDITLVN